MLPRLARLFSFSMLLAFCGLPDASAFQVLQPPLTQISQVAALSSEDSAKGIPVQLQGTVTFVQPFEKNLFLQEDGPSQLGQLGQFVQFTGNMSIVPGDRVLVSGVTTSSFRADVQASQVRVLAHGSLPAPKLPTFEEMIQARVDGLYVQVSGRVLSAAFDQSLPSPNLRIRLQIPEGIVEAVVVQPGSLLPEKLIDAEIQVTGVAGGDFDGKMQMTGVWMDVNSWKDVTFLHLPTVDPWSLPITPMDRVISGYSDKNLSKRIRVTGTLTYFEPGALAVMEKEGKTILLETHSNLPLHAGQGVEATGFPGVSAGSVRIENAQLRPLPETFPVHPTVINWEDASSGRYAYNLVAMEGEVVAEVHDVRVDLFIIRADGHLFSASMRHDSADAALTATASTPPSVGSRVRVTGICFVDSGNHWRDRLWFDVHMRSLNDVAVTQEPSRWTPKRLAYVITLLSAIILVVVIWIGLLDRRLRVQTARVARQSQEEAMRERQMSRQEQQRSRILELISSAEPLPAVLREIQAMVSSRLYGAPCWFELNSQNCEGVALERPTGPAIVFEELFSPDGISLGFLLVTPRIQSEGGQEIRTALQAGARLAELAIDTRRLYTDLRHRSEYDLLTDIPNRFSMEKQLNQLMHTARQTGAIFGLIYVDFDRFKQVNDRYGHRVGDLYLQEGTRRMKAQLRNGDMLARIGGDEFVALVPILRSQADAEEIADRLERCFDDPFEIEGIHLLGSASVGLAVYPEDGTTQEELQRYADAAMYAHKEGKRHQNKLDEAVRKLLS